MFQLPAGCGDQEQPAAKQMRHRHCRQGKSVHSPDEYTGSPSVNAGIC